MLHHYYQVSPLVLATVPGTYILLRHLWEPSYPTQQPLYCSPKPPLPQYYCSLLFYVVLPARGRKTAPRKSADSCPLLLQRTALGC